MQFSIDQLALILNNDTLVLADPHLGYLENMQLGGATDEYQNFINRVTTLASKHSTPNVVIAGDVFDSFDYPPQSAIDAMKELHEQLATRERNLHVTPGNHDNSDAIDWTMFTDRSRKELRIHDALILHGHEQPSTSADTYVVGHLHPMLRVQSVKWPCYLYADSEFDGNSVFVLPTFNQRLGGAAITENYSPEISFPYGANGFGNYKPIVWDDNENTARWFPRLSEFSPR